MSYVRPVNMQEAFNHMFKTLRNGAEMPFENFNGERTIMIYKGNNRISKVTKKLDSKLVFRRTLVNIGTKREPNMATEKLTLENNIGDGVDVFFKTPGDSTKGVTLRIDRGITDAFEEECYLLTFKKDFKNMMELRSDKSFKFLIDRIFGTHFIIDEKGHFPSDINISSNRIFRVSKDFVI